MTTDLEKSFFDTFSIEPECETRAEHRKHECYGMVDCDECASAIYPQITDTHYLKLVCMLLNVLDGMDVYVNYDVEKVKEKTLRLLMTFQDDIYSQVQELFKE